MPGVSFYNLPADFVKPLDVYPNAVRAYSLRKLRTAYTGSALRVRRASDNAELDIGFNQFGQLDRTALENHCTGTNGFVITWYDQSGNSYNATRTVAASQPKIYDSVNKIIYKDSKPAILFDGVNDILFYNGNTGIENNKVYGFVVVDFLSLASTFSPVISWKDNTVINQPHTYLTTLLNIRYEINYYGFGGTLSTNDNVLLSFQTYSSPNTPSIIRENAVNVVSSSRTNGLISNTGHIGGGGFAIYYSHCTMQEIILYASNQSANQAAIETNINNYYNIYP